ncbi:hypothetical protein QN277_017495 [Acacia crassicarpa]|uniref:Uncharacterized protein n=1 Tax=Acacia crassicarpa TaxID=499986 RepID=A0AAE1MRW8_9FABA|nr:hypothetical protein QN277_017495 [Acacia crassicarpa]
MAIDIVHEGKTAPQVDDDGIPKRTGNALTAMTHIYNNRSGSACPAMGDGPTWMDQWNRRYGHFFMHLYAHLQYKYPHPVSSTRNCTYMQAVKSYLGVRMHIACGIV